MNVVKKTPILWKTEAECCGCSACMATCPANAIDMKHNDKGFTYPVINKNKCIQCGLCLDICAFKKDRVGYNGKTKHVFAVQTHENILLNSSSGGLFTALSDYIIREGGAIISPIYDYKTHELNATLYDRIDIREKAHGSKYFQANMNDSFRRSVQWVNNNPGKRLLFVGTGCQAAGFREFLLKKKIDRQVIIVDLICNGVPSPGLWKKYVDFIEDKNQNNRIKYITFKDKRNGWIHPSAYCIINDKEVSLKGYTEWFYGGYSLRESCYSCPYTKIDRKSDITIGDFWGVSKYYPDFFNPLGVSLAIIHTDKGEELFHRIYSEIKYIEIEKEYCIQPRLIKPAPKPWNQKIFWNDLERKGIEYCEEKYKDKTGRTISYYIKQSIKMIGMKK